MKQTNKQTDIVAVLTVEVLELSRQKRIGDDMGKSGYLTRYHCDNPDCKCEFFRGTNEKCPVCGTSDVSVAKRGVGD